MSPCGDWGEPLLQVHGSHAFNIHVGHLCELEGGHTLGVHLNKHPAARAKASLATDAVPLLLGRADDRTLALPLLRRHDRPAHWVLATPVLEADMPGPTDPDLVITHSSEYWATLNIFWASSLLATGLLDEESADFS